MSTLKVNNITDSSGTKTLLDYNSVTGTVTLGSSAVTGNLAINIQDVTVSNNLSVVTQAVIPLLKISSGLSYNRDVPRVTLDLGDSTDSLLIPRGTDAQRPATPISGMLRYSTTSNAFEVYNGTSWNQLNTITPANGLTPEAAGTSAQAIKSLTGTTTNGLYYISVPTVGTRQLYSEMSGTYGWMLFMRGRGSNGLAYGDSRWTDSSESGRTDLHTNSYGDYAKDSAFYYMNNIQYIRLDAGGFSGANADGNYRSFIFSFSGPSTANNLMFTTGQRMNWSAENVNTRAQWKSTFGHDREGNPVFERYGSQSNHSLGFEGRGRIGCGQPMMFGYQASDSNGGGNDTNSGLGTNPNYCGGSPGVFAGGSWMGNGGLVKIWAR